VGTTNPVSRGYIGELPTDQLCCGAAPDDVREEQVRAAAARSEIDDAKADDRVAQHVQLGVLGRGSWSQQAAVEQLHATRVQCGLRAELREQALALCRRIIAVWTSFDGTTSATMVCANASDSSEKLTGLVNTRLPPACARSAAE
jgi:hypothetical protein